MTEIVSVLAIFGPQPIPAEAVLAFRRFVERLQPILDHHTRIMAECPAMPTETIEPGPVHAFEDL